MNSLEIYISMFTSFEILVHVLAFAKSIALIHENEKSNTQLIIGSGV
jgi:hypothetical protein